MSHAPSWLQQDIKIQSIYSIQTKKDLYVNLMLDRILNGNIFKKEG